ncbi:translation initiation factor 3- RNA-binding subunit [Apiospora saccharicola]|uniref:Translation initiation factor 3- RNA-binding subunit n=1 Tax=Apiospora saccharicola TaxID=335842 RepID=A0ABR1UER2_9PEZI
MRDPATDGVADNQALREAGYAMTTGRGDFWRLGLMLKAEWNSAQSSTELIPSPVDLRALFEEFGAVTPIYLAPNGYFAFISFADRADAVRACQRYDGFCYKYLVMRVEFAKSSSDDHARPRLWLEYPDDGEFVSRDPRCGLRSSFSGRRPLTRT